MFEISEVIRARFLLRRGPDAEKYQVRRFTDEAPQGIVEAEFETDGVNGKTPDGTAERNVSILSEFVEGVFGLFRDEGNGTFVHISNFSNGLGWRPYPESSYPHPDPMEALKGV